MTQWIESVDCKALRTMASNSTSMYLVSLPDGQILWANRSFLDWSKYTLHELTAMTWIDLSAKDDGLVADMNEVKSLDQYSLSYSVQKRYIPKGASPQLGNLYVTRYPPSGQIEFCWCRWEPLYNGTAKAFEASLKSQADFSISIAELARQVSAMRSQSVEERAFGSVIQLAQKYPKASWVVFVILVFMVAGNNTISILNNVGLLGPMKVIEAKP